MKDVRLLLVCVSALGLSGCTEWLAKQKQMSERRTAEAEVVEAVEYGDMKTVREWLEEDPTLADSFRVVPGRRSTSSRRAETALTMAARKGRLDMATLLLEKGADPKLVDGNGDLPLGAALAAGERRLELVRLLLDRGADPAQADGDGQTAIHHVANSTARHTADLLPLLLAQAKEVGARNHRGWTALHHAAGSANVFALRQLVAHGADPDASTAAPQPTAAMPGDVADATPLAIVARDRQIVAAAVLCALGADVDARDATGASARDVAARVAAAEAAQADPVMVDLARHRNMAAFLARGGGCDALAARRRRGESVPDAEVERIANESECEAGWGWACGQAGWAFHRGEGAARDQARALALFRRGCAESATPNEWSCGMVGIFHVEGSATRKDPAEGARWLKRGCEPPDPKRSDEQACNRLGLLHSEGQGAPKDLPRARALFKKACDAGYQKACTNLARHPVPLERP
jgi:TPR repeat protein